MFLVKIIMGVLLRKSSERFMRTLIRDEKIKKTCITVVLKSYLITIHVNMLLFTLEKLSLHKLAAPREFKMV
jgi:hypothetical protein